MKLIRIIKAIRKAYRCKDSLTFVKVIDGVTREVLTYDSDMFWTNSDLLRMQEQGYRLHDQP